MRAAVSLLISCLFVFALSDPAAAAPPTGPMPIASHGFETTPTAPEWRIERVRDIVHPSTAWWGRMSNVRRTGTFSLWCAGTPAVGSPRWGNYPANTKGDAIWNLPQLADFYSSEVSFFYTMPSVGAADAFSFGFRADGAHTGPWRSIIGTTGATAWVQRGLNLSSAPPNEISLSRRSGHVWFRFFDLAEGPAMSPMTGRGPSIDDVAVTGFRYGPVRNLSASTTLTAGVTLTWARPHRSTAATSTEERVVNYRIWRRPLGAATWTDVARLGNDATSWQDTTAVADTQYEYSVVAFDPLPGNDWGEVAASVMGLRPSTAVVAFTMTPNSLTLEHRWPLTLSYRIQNISVAQAITGITLRDSFAAITGADVPSSVAPGQSGTVSRIRFPAASGEVTATLTAVAGSESLTVTVGAFITRNAPPPRVAGADRLSTALKVAHQAYPPGGARNVIIATGWDYPDALSASALAGVKDGPVLLVNRTSATPGVLQAIRDLKATHAYVVGGSSVVADSVMAEIDALPGVSATRVAGANRAATARDVALRVNGVRAPDTVFLATGWNFPDALAASSLAANQGWPILLTRPDVLSPEADAALRAIKPGRVVILGGTGAVSSAIEDAVRGNAAYGSPAVIRAAGNNRYLTAQAIVDWGRSPSGGALAPAGIGGVYLATGANFPDALAAGVLAGKPGHAWRPLMLTDPNTLSAPAAAVIGNGARFVTVIGGAGAVSTPVETAARRLVVP